MTDHDADLPPIIKRRLRRQQLVTFAFVVIFCISTAYWQQAQTHGLRRAQKATYDNCRTIFTGFTGFNMVIDQLARNAANSKGITAEQKTEALKTYAGIHMPLAPCDGLAP